MHWSRSAIIEHLVSVVSNFLGTHRRDPQLPLPILRDLHELRRGVVLAADLVVLTSRPGKPSRTGSETSWKIQKIHENPRDILTTGIYSLKLVKTGTDQESVIWQGGSSAKHLRLETLPTSCLGFNHVQSIPQEKQNIFDTCVPHLPNTFKYVEMQNKQNKHE